MTLGLMEATAETIAQTNRELAGFAQTRFTLPGTEGDIIVAVESTLGWPDSGTVVIYGKFYTYTFKTLTTLEGLTWTNGATVFNGLATDLESETIVTDYSRATSAIDLLRRAIMVDWADGSDLSTVGRNIGVVRRPFLRDDEIFRRLIKAIAYTKKGTIYSIELALTAFVGAGNFEIYENLITHPNKVFIRLTNDAANTDVSAGKTYLRGGEFVQSDSTSQVTVGGAVISRGIVSSVQLKDENHLTDCRTAYPSADSIVEYTGDPGTTLWALVGTGAAEGVHVTQISGVLDCIEFSVVPPTDFCIYAHDMRILNVTPASVEAVVTVPTGAPTNPNFGTGACGIDDGVKVMMAGIETTGAGTFTVQFAVPDTGAAVAGSVATVLTRDQFYSIKVVKDGVGDTSLFIDGVLIDRLPYASFPGTSGVLVGCLFGTVVAIGVHEMRVKQFSFWSHEPQDYWGIGDPAGVTSSPDIITTGIASFGPGDVGKKIRTYDPTTPLNNGDWEIYEFVGANSVKMRGSWWPGTAALGVEAVTRVTIAETNPQQFTYPDDIGKSIEIQNSTEGNDGAYVITALLERGTLTDFSTYDTVDASGAPNTEKTNIAVIVGALAEEHEAEWRLLPGFPGDPNISWEMPGAGVEAAGVLSLQNPIVLPYHPIVVDVHYSEVLSAQALFDWSVVNNVIQASPLLLEYYPFYLADPIGFMRAYLDDLTVAGVVPDYVF